MPGSQITPKATNKKKTKPNNQSLRREFELKRRPEEHLAEGVLRVEANRFEDSSDDSSGALARARLVAGSVSVALCR